MIEEQVLSDRAIEYTIDMVFKKLEELIRSKSGDQKDLMDELKTLKSELANFVSMIGKGLGGETIAKAAMDRESRIKLLESEIQKSAGLTKKSLPDRKKLEKSAHDFLGEFRELIASSVSLWPERPSEHC